MLCELCNKKNVCLIRPSNKQKLCKECFITIFEEEVHSTILKKKMFDPHDKICIGVSGGKDSSVLVHVLVQIKKKYNYEWQLFLLAIDEGIKGYRDDSLKVVYKLQEIYNIPLKILKFEDIFTFTMDDIVKFIGKKNNCTVCGVFRRQALEKGAILFNSTKLVTGHNADDSAETILMNICRGNIDGLVKNINFMKPNEISNFFLNNQVNETKLEEQKNDENKVNEILNNCCLDNNCFNKNINYMKNENNNVKENNKLDEECFNVKIKEDNNKIFLNSQNNNIMENEKSIKKNFFIPRLKPLMLSYEKEIVLYAFHLKLNYFSTECIYSPNSFRGNLRSFIKQIEVLNPQFILNIIHSAEFFYCNLNNKKELMICIKCGSFSSNKICKACLIVSGLNNYTDNSFLYSEKKRNRKKKILINYEKLEKSKVTK